MFRNPPWNYIPFLQGMQYKHLCFSNTNLSAIIGRESESFFIISTSLIFYLIVFIIWGPYIQANCFILGYRTVAILIMQLLL